MVFRRYLGSLIDGLFSSGTMIGGGWLIANVGPQLTWVRVAWLGVIVPGYEPLLTAFDATLGQRITGFRARREAEAVHYVP